MNARTRTSWKIAVVACAALLLVAIGAIVVIEMQASSARGRQSASVVKLDKQLVALQKQLVDQQAATVAAESAAAASRASQTQKHTGSGNKAATPQPAAPATNVVTSDQKHVPTDGEIVDEMSLERAHQDNPNIPWYTGGTIVSGDWARVGVGAPQSYNIQPWSEYYHRVNGTWTYVTGGTGLTQADVPGCPPELLI